MAKAAPIIDHGKTIGHMIFCPGCKCGHAFFNPDACKNAALTFNGDVDNPTLAPSMLIGNDGHHKRCHSFVREGKIQFLSDCEHELKGQTVELPDI